MASYKTMNVCAFVEQKWEIYSRSDKYRARCGKHWELERIFSSSSYHSTQRYVCCWRQCRQSQAIRTPSTLQSISLVKRAYRENFKADEREATWEIQINRYFRRMEGACCVWEKAAGGSCHPKVAEFFFRIGMFPSRAKDLHEDRKKRALYLIN